MLSCTTCLRTLARDVCDAARKDAEIFFSVRTEELELPMNESSLSVVLEDAKTAALGNFKSNIYGDEELQASYQKDLSKYLVARCDELIFQNKAKSESECQERFDEMISRLNKIDDLISIPSYDVTIMSIMADFDASTHGPAQSIFRKKLEKFADTKRNSIIKIQLFTKETQDTKKQLSKLEETTRQIEEQNKAVKQLMLAKNRKLEEEKELIKLAARQKEESLEQEKARVQREAAERLRRAEAEKSSIQRQLEAQNERLESQLAETTNSYQAQLRRLQTQVDSLSVNSYTSSSSSYSSPYSSPTRRLCGATTTKGTPCKLYKDSCTYH